jgi:putative acetyltransferase
LRRLPVLGGSFSFRGVALIIRPFAASDAEAWLDVHRAAVRVIAAGDYSQAVIDAWAPPVDARMIEHLQTGPSGTRIVAELDGELAGIGELVPENGELRACYVAPRFARRGVGKALVAELEALARTAGIAALSLASSVTAEPFYLRLGYDVTGRGSHVLDTGEPMACLFMTKSL